VSIALLAFDTIDEDRCEFIYFIKLRHDCVLVCIYDFLLHYLTKLLQLYLCY